MNHQITWLLKDQSYESTEKLLNAIADHIQEQAELDLGSIDYDDDPTTAREALNQHISRHDSVDHALEYLRTHVDYEDLPLSRFPNSEGILA